MTVIVKRDGEMERFDEKKLYATIFRPAREAGYGKKKAEKFADHITDQVTIWANGQEDQCVTSDEIRDKTQELLEEQDEAIAHRYELGKED
ncbi:MAG: ATP cone domain-containing protein [Candidatus Nanohaloarchaeota archaeon QJJ-5]|nr:ATP cone domain-containing protein [Candidatus Nanohaloarchaeota archaeon QJJ-5]